MDYLFAPLLCGVVVALILGPFSVWDAKRRNVRLKWVDYASVFLISFACYVFANIFLISR